MKLYRADNPNRAKGQHFALELVDAIAYKYNDGFGGNCIYEADTKGLNIMNIEREEAHFLRDILGENWIDEYQTEAWALESPEVLSYMKENGIDGIRFLDDFPNEASVLFIPKGMEMVIMNIDEKEGLLIGLKRYEYIFLAPAREYLAGRVWESEDNYLFEEDLEIETVIELLENGKSNDGDFVLEIR